MQDLSPPQLSSLTTHEKTKQLFSPSLWHERISDELLVDTTQKGAVHLGHQISIKEGIVMVKRELEFSGPKHPDTLLWVNNLAMLLKRQGKLEEAGLRSLECTEVAEVSRRKAVLDWPGPGPW